ncbi:MAG: sn-glycerol-3-phosphate ABC transporter ATP-binding protein UgpC, partial [Syntrophobacterales bacterium]
MAKVRLVELTKKFGTDIIAVDNLNLDIRDREFVTLVGPSGCGKSTTLRMIAGLERPTQGEIYFDERCVNDDEPRDRNIAMVFQSYALYPHMNIRENLEYGLKKRKVPRPERNEKVKGIARLLQIDELLERRPKELSGGQRQRVALGRALIREPVVFLLDEPLSNLDAKLRVHMRAELIKLHHSIQTTMIYVTHDQLEAMTMSDRIVVMNEGRIQQVGTPKEVYDHPANLFVAGFIGTPTMNFIECTAKEDRGLLKLDAGIFRLGLPQEFRKHIHQGSFPTDVILGIRPEDVQISESEANDSIPASVSVVELVGSEKIVFSAVGDQTIISRISPDRELEMDEQVYLIMSERKMHLFDKGTGDA